MTENTAATEMTRSLNGDEWQIIYDVGAKYLFVRRASEDGRISINDFLAQRGDTEAGLALHCLIIDMFPPDEEAEIGELD